MAVQRCEGEAFAHGEASEEQGLGEEEHRAGMAHELDGLFERGAGVEDGGLWGVAKTATRFGLESQGDAGRCAGTRVELGGSGGVDRDVGSGCGAQSQVVAVSAEDAGRHVANEESGPTGWRREGATEIERRGETAHGGPRVGRTEVRP